MVSRHASRRNRIRTIQFFRPADTEDARLLAGTSADVIIGAFSVRRPASGRAASARGQEPTESMSTQSLEDVLRAAGNPVTLLRNSQIGPYAFPVVRHEFTNWRDEQRAWRETCALFDQSHHMTDLYIEGPDTLRLLSELGINSFNNFKVNQAKQFVACNYDGYVIGDAILFYLSENRFNLVGRPPAANWVQYHVETGGYKATA